MGDISTMTTEDQNGTADSDEEYWNSFDRDEVSLDTGPQDDEPEVLEGLREQMDERLLKLKIIVRV